MAQTTGRNLYEKLIQYAGLTPEVVNQMFPMDKVFNMDYKEWKGDKIVFHDLYINDLSIDGDTVTGEHPVMQTAYVYGDTIEMELDSAWNRQWVLEGVRTDFIEDDSQALAGKIEVVAKSKFKVDEELVLREAQNGLRKISSGSKEHTLHAKFLVDFMTPIQLTIADIKAANPNVAYNEYTLLISESYANRMPLQANSFVDFMSGKLPESGVRPAFSVGEIVVVPDKYLVSYEVTELDANGAPITTTVPAPDFIVYIKKFAPYGYKEHMSQLYPMTNEYTGYIGYGNKKKWGTNFKNFKPKEVDEIGFKVTGIVDTILDNLY